MARPGSSLLRQVYNSSVHRPIGVPLTLSSLSWKNWVHVIIFVPATPHAGLRMTTGSTGLRGQ